MHVVLVGPGRLGRSLAILLPRSGHTVSMVGRGERVPRGDLIWLTVPDRSIAEVSSSLPADATVLHASGSLSLDVLSSHGERGSLHPLMTFPGPEVSLPDLRGVPAAVDGTPSARQAALKLAADLGLMAIHVTGDRRLYHAAAVIAGNFATILLAGAARALQAAGLPADQAPGLLLPLAIASLRNASADPARALTGPIARADAAVLDGHRAALREAGLDDLLPWYDENVRSAAILLPSRPS